MKESNEGWHAVNETRLYFLVVTEYFSYQNLGVDYVASHCAQISKFWLLDVIKNSIINEPG